MSDDKPQVIFRKSTNVILRPLQREDIPFLTKWINDPEITQYLASYSPMREEDEEDWYEYTRNKQSEAVLAIIVDEKMIGVMGLSDINHINGTATTGAFIGEKEYWGQGYGSEAKMLLLDYAFNTLNLRKIHSGVIAFNERSYKYSLKCGYKETGVQKEEVYVSGKYWDEILLAVFKTDWLPLWKEFAEKHKIPTL